jgi:hypothetical protein
MATPWEANVVADYKAMRYERKTLLGDCGSTIQDPLPTVFDCIA